MKRHFRSACFVVDDVLTIGKPIAENSRSISYRSVILPRRIQNVSGLPTVFDVAERTPCIHTLHES